MWTLARIDLGLSDEEFRGMTMRLLFALLERHNEVQRREDLRTGLIATLLYNPNRKKGARPMKPEDFFPARGKRVKASPGRGHRRAPSKREKKRGGDQE